MMAVITKQALRSAENLTLPAVQVIVINANMSCSHCRQRASRMISKMKGLLDYVVDIPNKEVIMRGAIDSKKRKSYYMKLPNPSKNGRKFRRLPAPLRVLTCFAS